MLFIQCDACRERYSGACSPECQKIAELPEEERYHTLSGMLMMLLGRLPQTADCVDWQGWRFEVVDMDGKRVDKVLATRQPPGSPGRDSAT